MGFLFDNILVNPMLNVLVVLQSVLFGNFGLAIIFFTVIVRVATLPLQLRIDGPDEEDARATAPDEGDPGALHQDPQKRSQETMRLYREAGVNPLGCLGPMFIQLPIWIGLYQGLLKSLGTNPDDLVGLSQRLYSWNPLADTVVPINSSFLWLDLANPDPTPLLPVLVGISTWAQQKMMTMPAMDERAASTNRMMLWMMPLMLAFFAFSFPSGLALYWTVSNLIGVAIQGYSTRDWSPLIPKFGKPAPVPETAPSRPGS